MESQTSFVRYIGINYSGAETSDAYLPALRVYAAEEESSPVEVAPPNAKKHWTRRSIAEWLAQALAGDAPTAVGINHAFSFPLAYFVQYRLPPDWRTFLDDFCRYWPTGEANTYVDFVRDGLCGNALARHGDPSWMRLTDLRSGRPQSVFHFERPGSVAKATHAGLPWLRFLDRNTTGRLHFWPLDGWHCPPGKSILAEVYPARYAARWPQAARNRHQHAAYTIAVQMRSAGDAGRLSTCTQPVLDPEAERIGRIEGWRLDL
jgi:hypothetical protein